MKEINIICYANKACFRNKNKKLITDIGAHAILGLLGNICGIWRAPEDTGWQNTNLDKWMLESKLMLENISYTYTGQITEAKSMAFGSGFYVMEFHTNAILKFKVSGKVEAIDMIREKIKRPCGIAYLGTRDCPAEVFISE